MTETVRTIAKSQDDLIKGAEADLARIPEWSEFTAEEQQNALSELQGLSAEIDEDIAGLKKLISAQYDITNTIEALKKRIIEEGRERRRPPEPKPGLGEKPAPRQRQTVKLPARISNKDELENLIRRLQELRHDAAYCEFDLEIGEE